MVASIVREEASGGQGPDPNLGLSSVASIMASELVACGMDRG